MRNTVIALCFILTNTVALGIPVQWDVSSGGNDHYYEWVNDLVTWSDANASAEESSFLGMPGYLVSIHSADENEFVRLLSGEINGLNVWIGLNDVSAEGVFEWTTGEPVTFTNWAPNVPDNEGNEDFVVLDYASNVHPDGTWNDKPDNKLHGYIIEYGSVIPEPSSITMIGLVSSCAVVARRWFY